MAKKVVGSKRNSGGSDPDRIQTERSYEIGMDEAWKANMKSAFDDFRAHTNRLLSDAQDHHTAQLNSLLTTSDQAAKNLVAQCQLNMTQAAENHRHGADRLWAGTDTAQGAVDVSTINAAMQDQVALKALGLIIVEAIAAGFAAKGN